MAVATQFTGTLNPGETNSWFTFGWPLNWFMDWSVRPTSLNGKVEIVSLEVENSGSAFTYYLTIKNTGAFPSSFEALYNYTQF
ncbi:MAG: hypothetical protein V7K50_18560 [Nostoc sp.]|uniref:hypothetical protein n=1 Tax=Nostoc sp. TaxID=1180 RepID=UPI002FFA9941